MRKLLLVLLCVPLLLCGCGADRAAEEYGAYARELEDKELSFTAALRAEYPDRTVSYRLGYEEADGGCRVRVLEPEQISGICLSLSADGSQINFEDLTLETGPLDRYGLSPVTALPALVRALRSGHLESRWSEAEQTVWELQLSDTLTVQVWLDGSLTPQHAELISEGRVAVSAEISDWRTS